MSKILAFDLGASSGRAMLAEYKDGKIRMQEIHRFTNDPVTVNGTMYWDTLRLFYDIKTGITKAVNAGGFDYVGIDTWGVDFGLVGEDGQLVTNPVHYRDKRTDDYLDFPVPAGEVYASTGIQQMQINTLYQLESMVRNHMDQLERTKMLLFTPDLLNYFLTGVGKTEYTIASTSQMLDARARYWDMELIKKAGIPTQMLGKIVQPGTICGTLSDEICEELSAPKAKVVCIASHDTASAVASIPTQAEDFLYISCGTWALLGTELKQPVLDEKAQEYNFANEGGINGTIRFLKNIMGTWLIQESRRQWIREGNEYGFGELESMAKQAQPFKCLIDVDRPEFIKPGNIPRRIAAYCERTGQPVPQGPGEIIRCIDESLALKFRYGFECVEDCTGIGYDVVHILGGGTKSALLCQMTADASGKKVAAGPDEATVLGNIAVQLIAAGEIASIAEARQVVADSCELKEYAPQGGSEWEKAYANFRKIME
ncbi:rhamnulokinase [Christensenellaceae bacterium OttesenSCG-928-K19]|nr:rhamnulokinase [Christensenellaceae bacterium OttesenSCG-928-K19]